MYSFGGILIFIVVIAACIAIAKIATKQFGTQIPQWVISIFWILLVAVVAIFAIRFLLSL